MRHPRFACAVLTILGPLALSTTPPPAASVVVSSASAQEPADSAAATGASVPVSLEFHGEVRHRLEVDGREKITPGSSSTEQSFLRSRLSVRAALPKNVSLLVQAQDARVYGEEPSPESGTGSKKDLHQGYVLAEDLMAPGVWLRLGRMELAYGNERLIGANDFSNTGRAFDGVVLGYRGAQFDVEVFETKIGESVGNTFRGRDYDFFGAFATVRAIPDNTIEAFAFFDRDADTLATGEDALKRLTLGGRLAGSRMGFTYEAEGGLQSGDQGSQSVSAAYFGGRVAYTVAHAYAPTFGVGADWLSGDADSADGEFKAFDTLFGTNHGFYGIMDLFNDIPEDTRNLGLLDLFAKVSLTPVHWLTASAAYHNFKSAEDLVISGTGGESSFSSFGSELDLIGEIPCTKNVTFEAGLSYFVPGNIIEETMHQELGPAVEADNAYWGYLQTRVAF